MSVFLLYLARTPAHRSIHSLSRVVHNGLRLLSRSTLMAAERVRIRNKEVLFSLGQESTEHIVEREFQRVEDVIKRDLSGYPMLQRSMAEQHLRLATSLYSSSGFRLVLQAYLLGCCRELLRSQGFLRKGPIHGP